MIATSTDVQNRFGYYAELAQTHVIKVTKNGKVVFVMQPDKTAAHWVAELKELAVKTPVDYDLNQARYEALMKKHVYRTGAARNDLSN